MATDIVPGLFGLDPNQIQAQRQVETDKAAYQYAQLDPFARASMSMYKAGAGLARPLAGMMGGYDPQERESAQNKDIQSQIDHTTADGLMKGAQLFQQAGNPRMAAMYVQAAQAMKDKESSRALQAAQTKKALEYQPAGARDYEYEKMLEIIRDPEASDEDKDYARKRIDALNAKASGAGRSSGTTAGKTVNTTIGILTFDPQAKKWTYADGSEVESDKLRTMMPLGNDPTNAAAVAQAKAGGAAAGKEVGGAQMQLIDAVPMVEVTTRQVNELLNHPGFQSAVGMGIPAAKRIPGSKEADFAARLEQIQGGAFLQAFESLRGGGQITETEGAKATSAYNRMSDATSEKEFRAAAKDYIDILNIGLDRLRKKAGTAYQQPTQSQPVAPVQPVAQPQPASSTPPFSAKTPAQVRALYKAGKLSREQAKAILEDMKSQGMEIK